MNLDEFLKPFGIKKKLDAQIVSRSYFIVKDKQFLGKNPAYSGECIAHIRGPVLIPSIDFLQQIVKEARKHVIINPKQNGYSSAEETYSQKASLHTTIRLLETE